MKKIFAYTLLLSLTFGMGSPMVQAFSAVNVYGQLDSMNTNYSNNRPAENTYGFGGFVSGICYASSRQMLFVADSNAHRIMGYYTDGSGTVLDNYADIVLGRDNFIIDTTYAGSTSDRTLAFPRSLACDTVNNILWVSDSGNNRVLGYDISIQPVNGMAATYVLGQPDFVSSGVNFGMESTMNPQGIYVDTIDDRLFVADSGNNRVLVFDISGGVTNGMSAVAMLGAATSGLSDIELERPVDIAYDSARKYIFVADSNHNRVMVFDISGGLVSGMAATYVLGQVDMTSNSSGTNETQFSNLYNLEFDSVTQKLYVLDAGNSRVMVFDTSAGITNGMPAIDVIGQTDMFTNSQGDHARQFTGSPENGMMLHNNYLFVGDYARLVIFPADATAGSPAVGGLGMITRSGLMDLEKEPCEFGNCFVTATGLFLPVMMWISETAHALFISDIENNRVVQYFLGVLHDSDDTTADRVLGAFDPDGSLSAAEQVQLEALGADLKTPFSIVPMENGLVMIQSLDTGSLKVFDTAAVLANGATPTRVYDLSGSTNQTAINGSLGVAYDTERKYLFVAAEGQNRILVYDMAIQTSPVLEAQWVLGQADLFATVDYGATESSISGSVYSLAFDQARDYLFVLDSSYRRVMVFDTSLGITNNMPASFVLGQPDFNSDAPQPISAATFGFDGDIASLAYNPASKVLAVADPKLNRITGFDTSAGITNFMPASFVVGQVDFTTATSPSVINDSSFSPAGVAFDTLNNSMYVSDYLAHRVLQFRILDLPDSGFPSLVRQGEAIDFVFAVTDSLQPVTYTLVSQNLPPTMSVDMLSYRLTGTADTLGTFSFTIRAQTDYGPQGIFWEEKTYEFTISPNDSGSTGTCKKGGACWLRRNLAKDNTNESIENNTNESFPLGDTPVTLLEDIFGPNTSCPVFDGYLKKSSSQNSPYQVYLWQKFLSHELQNQISLDGIFGNETEKAVRAFQQKYAYEILAPWGITNPTGYIYIKTVEKARQIIGC
jgi:DNA-binding beta-propeller fold protein YncE